MTEFAKRGVDHPHSCRNAPVQTNVALASALVLVAVAACSTAPSTVKLKNGATGHVIAECRSTDECEARSKQKCGLGYGVHEKHEERREVSSGSGVYSVMGMTSTKIETRWKYVVECNPSLPVQTVVVTDALSQAEQELYESKAKVVSANNAIVRRWSIEAVCSLRPGPLRDEEIELARKEFGDFSCP